MQRIAGVYKITHVSSGLFYIGSSVSIIERWWAHRSDLKRQKHRNPRLQNYWNKYHADVFKWEILEEVSLSQLRQREQDYLDSERPFFNINPFVDRFPGGGAKVGHIVTAETRAKISASQKGCKRSPESVAASSASRRGMPRSLEARRKSAISMIGKNQYKRAYTHCAYGHLLPTELRADGRRRNCAPCVSRRSREYWQRQKRLAAAQQLNLV